MKSFSFFIYYSMIVDYDIIKKTHTHTTDYCPCCGGWGSG